MTDYNFYELIDDPDIQAEIKAKKKKKFDKDNPPEKIKKLKKKLKAHLVMERRKKMGEKKISNSKFYGYTTNKK